MSVITTMGMGSTSYPGSENTGASRESFVVHLPEAPFALAGRECGSEPQRTARNKVVGLLKRPGIGGGLPACRVAGTRRLLSRLRLQIRAFEWTDLRTSSRDQVHAQSHFRHLLREPSQPPHRPRLAQLLWTQGSWTRTRTALPGTRAASSNRSLLRNERRVGGQEVRPSVHEQEQRMHGRSPSETLLGSPLHLGAGSSALAFECPVAVTLKAIPSDQITGAEPL